MTGEITNLMAGVMPRFEGYVYPNEAIPHPLWGFLIVLYPYITGLVAGAFIMASLVRVFKSITVIPSVLWRYKKIKVMLLNTCTAMRHGIKLHCKIKRLFL